MKPSLGELENKARQVGSVQAQAYLRRISAADLADYMGHEGIRSDLGKAYAAAVADVGDKKAMKSAVSAARNQAVATMSGARATTGGINAVIAATERAIQRLLTEQPLVHPRVTISGRPQPVPESSDTIERRFRLFWECTRRLADEPLTQPDARGRLLGKGSGLEEAVAAIAPLFQHERSLIRWVALRGGISSVYGATLRGDSPEPVIELTQAMGLRLTDREGGGVSVIPLTAGELPGRQLDAALALASAVYAFLWDYERFVGMTIDDMNGYPAFAALTDTGGLDCIAWSAVALLRIGRAQAIAEKVPEPDALTEPGWYVDPLFARYERYWDGSDWMSSVREVGGQQGTVSLR
jgi:hypothetical protein